MDFFKTAVDSSNEGIIFLNEESQIIYANKRFEEMLGYSPGELVGQNARIIVWESEIPDFQERIQKRKIGIAERHERTLRKKDGLPLPVLVSFAPLFENGEYRGTSAIVIEISRFKQLEENFHSVAQELKTLEAIVNRSPAIAFVWKPEEGLPVQYVSENISQFGYEKKEFENGNLLYLDIIYPEDRERVVEEGREFRRQGRNYYFQHYRIITRNGDIRWVDDRTIVNRDPSGRVINTFGIILDVTSQIQKEKAAFEAEAKLKSFFEASPDLIYLKDTKGRNLEVNSAYAHYFGMTPLEIQGKKDSEIMPPSLAEQCAKSDTLVIKGQTAIRVEEKILNEKGERVFDTIKFPIKGTEGEIIGIGGISRDITELRKATDALKQQGEILKVIMDHAQDLIYRYRLFPQPGFEYVSPSSTKITGYTPEEHYADPDLGIKIVHPDDRPILEAFWKDQGSYQKPIQLRWVKKDGTIFWTEQINTPVYDDSGKIVAIVGVARDITEQKKAQEQVLESERNLRAFLEGLMEPAILLDTEGKIIFANKNASLKFGFPPIINSNVCLFDYLNQDLGEKLRLYFARVINKKESLSGEVEIGNRTYLLQTYPWESEKGKVEKIIILMVDITERKKFEEEREKMKNTLIYSVSHDLKTPLMVMEASLDLIDSSDPKDREKVIGEYLPLFKKNLNQMKRRVENLLLSQRAILSEIKPSVQKVNVFRMFGEVLSAMRTLAQSKGIELEERVLTEPVFSEFDPELISRALENIISNAIKFSPRGEKVTVTLEVENGELRFVVEDRGPGIPPEEIKEIFQPFKRFLLPERRYVPGTGLGLFVSQKLVQAHGGDVVLESSPGKGTKAIIIIPIRTEN